ncbi:H-2 class I histocompatibility antigen, Q9 alpha chain-like, partial [Colossoma macropomum]|uniref:H-2 class I histocompatibility antigen, Q9 alpha chain-like n=1 Tax=Colossoma macropomum TaxID=42526 RepID=UPI001864AFB9
MHRRVRPTLCIMDYSTVAKKCLFVLAVNVHLVSAATHSLQYFYTAVTPGIHFPEFSVVGLVDGEQIDYYDSNIKKMIARTEWMKNSEGEDYWNTETQKAQRAQENFKASVGTIMKRFNQTEGVHTVQRMYGCEIHDDGTKKFYRQDGYDGEDFLSLDLNTLTWAAPNPKAFITKLKWEKTTMAGHVKSYLENECIEWLQKYVEYGRSTVERKVPPKVDLFQKDSSSPVVCHATGFFPKSVMISWQKNGEDLHEDVEPRETLLNQDRTFQKRSVLTVSAEELNKHHYTCIIQHPGLEKEMVLQASDCRVLRGDSSRLRYGMAVIMMAGPLLILIGCVGVFIWRKKKSGKGDFKPVSGKHEA